jgi:two-component system, sensor histidine kinase
MNNAIYKIIGNERDVRAAASDVLRASVRARCSQTAPSVLGLVLVTVAFVVVLEDVAAWRVLVWLLPMLAGVSWRATLARRAIAALETAPGEAVERLDRRLRWSSIINQAIVGTGIWSVGAAAPSHTTAVFVTIAIALYVVGVMINLSSDYGSFRISLPFVMAQPVAYWAMQGTTGAGIAVSLFVLSALMLTAVRHSAKTFRESVLIRRQKDALLEELRKQHETVQHALGAAEAANRSKAAFMAAASHDLRQPLYAISILAETALVHELDGGTREIIENQLQAIRVLRGLFDNLLDLSRFDTGGVQPIYRALSLRTLLQPLDLEFRTLCEAKHLGWSFDVADATVLTDADLMQRLVRNLLANAVRYTDAGRVSLRASVDGSHATLRVDDTGPGIAPAEQARIFEEFVQLDNPQRDREHGVGLGLSIVRRIDALLQTGMELQSTVGAGTCFSLTLPVIASSQGDQRRDSARAQSHSITGMRVWLVDDDVLVRTALASQFAAWGCDCTVLTGRPGIFEARSVQGGWPDAIILDDMLGRHESGLDIAQEIAPHIGRDRILLVSGNSSPERVAALRESGCGFLPKPASAESLRAWLVPVHQAALEAERSSAA